MKRDSLATALLCTRIGYNDKYQPISTDEWKQIILSLKINGYTPKIFLEADKTEYVYKLGINESLADKIELRLKKADLISEKITMLEASNIFIMTDEDIEFPILLKKVCKTNPPLLYYAGNPLIANTHACAILGSREINDYDIKAALALAERAISANQTIITGGGSGIDYEVERFAYQNGGKVIQFCGGGLSKKVKNEFYKKQLDNGSLLILSEVTPITDFNLKFAASRNKYIYACAENAFIIRATMGKSTFEGAKEAIDNDYSNVFCWDKNEYQGNMALIEKGAYPFKVKLKLV